MNTVSFDAANLSDKLGLYDFFNVIISGATLVFGLCSISENLYNLIRINMSVDKGLLLVLVIYIAGLAIQELGALTEKYCTHVKENSKNLFLTDENSVVANELLLKRYRYIADRIYQQSFPGTEPDANRFRGDSGYSTFVYAMVQYRLAYLGKCKKVEKMRAMCDMSRALMVCFGVLALLSFGIINLLCFEKVFSPWRACIYRYLWSGYVCLAFLFYHRMRRNRKNMILIMLGYYDAYDQLEQVQRNANDGGT